MEHSNMKTNFAILRNYKSDTEHYKARVYLVIHSHTHSVSHGTVCSGDGLVTHSRSPAPPIYLEST